ncbi:Prophage endopeptidase tail [compost metagenome]
MIDLMNTELIMDTELIKPKLFLCKPDLRRSTYHKLAGAFHIKQTVSLGNINELSFELPLYITGLGGILKKNTHLDSVRPRFLLRFEKGSYKEYYIIDKIEKSSNDRDSVFVQCFSLGYELNSKLIKDYSVESYNLTAILRDLLKQSIWNIGYIDVQFDLKYRSFEHSGSVLEGVQKLATTFHSLIVWDTNNRQISFYDPEHFGQNKGFRTSFGRLMKDVTQESNFDEFCTRLMLFGKDGLSIQSVNPLGTNFIQNFSYFMYPFQQDSQGHIISHSDYLSDNLCLKLLQYDALVNSKSGSFQALLTQRNNMEVELSVKENEYAVLYTQLLVIEDNLDTANGTGQSTSDLIQQKNNKSAELTQKQAQIDSLSQEISALEQSIQALKEQLNMENNLTADELKELNAFIIEKEFSSDIYDDPMDLLEDGKREFEKLREPKLVAKVSLVNFFEILTEQHQWNKLVVGDMITVEHEKLGISMRANVTEIEFDYEESSIDVTVSNAKELLTDEDRFLQNLYKSVHSSNVVDMSRTKWDDATTTANEVASVIDNTWNAVKRDIVAGVNESVEISRKGILIKDPDDPDKYIVMQHGQIALTQDGGNSWKTAILPDRIVAERVMGKLLAGVNLQIDATDAAGNKTFSVNQTGVKIMGLALTIEGGLPANQLDPQFKDGLVQMGRAYNGVVIDTANGLVITTNNNLVRTKLNATEGFSFEKYTSGQWVKELFYDVSKGNLVIRGEIDAQGLKVKGKDVLTSDDKIKVSVIEDLVVGGNVKMGPNATISWGQVSNQPYIPVLPSYIQQTKIGSTYIESPTISAGTMSATKINGAEIRGGSITSNTTIDVTTDLKVGNNIIFMDAQSSAPQTIVFPGRGSITFKTNGLVISGFSGIEIVSSSVGINSGIGYEEIATQPWVLANAGSAKFK